MARLTPFVSTDQTTPAINNVRANPDVYSQVSDTNARGYANEGAAFNEMLTAAEHLVNKPDPLYVAQAHAGMSTAMFGIMNDAKAKAQPGDDAVTPVLNQYDKLAQGVLANAPNMGTQRHLAASLIQHRAVVQDHMQGMQDSLNQQQYLQDFSGSAQQLSTIVQKEPQQLADVQSQLDAQAAALTDKGVPAHKVAQVREQAGNAMELVAAQANAAQDPIKTLKDADAGVYDYLGASHKGAIMRQAGTTLDTQIKGTDQNLDLVRKSILDGFETPTQTQDIFNQTRRLAASLDDAQIERKSVAALDAKQTQVTGLIAANKDMQGKTPAELQQMQLALNYDMARTPGDAGNLALKKDISSLITNRLTKMKDNPFQVDMADGTIIPPTIPLSPSLNSDPNALAQFTKERQSIALQGQARYGDGYIPFSDGELTSIKNSTKDLPPTQKLQALGFLANLDPSVQTAVAAKVFKPEEAGSFSTAVNLLPYDKDTALEIAKGMELRANKDSKIGVAVTGAKASKIVGDMFGNLLDNDPRLIHQYADAANAIVSHRQATGIGQTLPEDDFKAALEKVSGVQSVSNGFRSSYNTITPFKSEVTKDGATFTRMTGSEFADTIDSIKSPDTVTKYGNGTPVFPLDGRVATASDLTKMQWIPVKEGQYIVTDAQKHPIVNDETGKPFIFNMKSYMRDQGQVH